MCLKSNIQNALKVKRWSVLRLSRESGVPKSTLADWTVGPRNSVNLEQLRKVARVLGVSVHQLAFGEPDPFESSPSAHEMIEEIFSGDVRVSLHRIRKKRDC